MNQNIQKLLNSSLKEDLILGLSLLTQEISRDGYAGTVEGYTHRGLFGSKYPLIVVNKQRGVLLCPNTAGKINYFTEGNSTYHWAAGGNSSGENIFI